MKKPKMDFSIPDDIEIKELDAIFSELDKYNVKYPDESEIDSAVDTLRMYMPREKDTFKRYMDRFSLLLNLAISEISFFSRAYWIISIILFLLGCKFTITDSGNPYAAVLFLAPVPFILGIIEIFRGREEGMLEIEMTCRLSAGEVMLSKLLLIGIYNILFDSVFTLTLGAFLPGINIMKVLISWMTPLTFIAGISLWLAVRIRANYAATIFISGWAVVVLVIAARSDISIWLMNLNIFIYLCIIFVGLLVFMIEVRNIRSVCSMEGRGAAVEIND